VALALGCARGPLAGHATRAPGDLVARAIRARGGPLRALVRNAEADVQATFAAGRWTWRTAFVAPDRFAWTIDTTGEPHHYLFDGIAVRAFIGRRQVAVDTAPTAPVRTLARFMAVANLDVLLLPGARVEPLPDGERPPGATAGLAVVLADGARYRLGLDGEMRVVSTAGPVELPTLGAGELVARYGDFRRVHGFVLPFRTTYAFDGQALADERALSVCPDPPDARDASFRDPTRLPECGDASGRRVGMLGRHARTIRGG
jgi:hypothetical protein